MKFTPHCNYQCRIDEQLLITDMYGIWNKEGTIKYANEVKQLCHSLIGGPWGRIADISAFEGGGDEVMKQIIGLQHWAVQNNCQFLFLVKPALLNRMVVENHREQGSYPGVEMFDDLQSAIEEGKRRLSEILKTVEIT